MAVILEKPGTEPGDETNYDTIVQNINSGQLATDLTYVTYDGISLLVKEGGIFSINDDLLYFDSDNSFNFGGFSGVVYLAVDITNYPTVLYTVETTLPTYDPVRHGHYYTEFKKALQWSVDLDNTTQLAVHSIFEGLDTQDIRIFNDATVDNDLKVKGNVDVIGNTDIGGNTYVGGILTVAGNTIISGDITGSIAKIDSINFNSGSSHKLSMTGNNALKMNNYTLTLSTSSSINQNLRTTDNITHNRVNISDYLYFAANTSRRLKMTGNNAVQFLNYTLTLTGSSSINQNLRTTDSPTFNNMTLNGYLAQLKVGSVGTTIKKMTCGHYAVSTSSSGTFTHGLGETPTIVIVTGFNTSTNRAKWVTAMTSTSVTVRSDSAAETFWMAIVF